MRLEATASATATARGCTVCFYGPDNVVFDRRGDAYITDTDRKSHFRILKVSARGTRLSEWKVFPVVYGRNSGPEGIAIDTAGDILVTDGGTLRVLKLSPGGKLVAGIGGKSRFFHDLGHVAVGATGFIYVAEGAQNRIQKFSPAGERVAIWQRSRGAGREQWRMPETIATRPDGSLVVEDWGNRRIAVLSASGKTQFLFGGPSRIRSSSGLCVDGKGNIYVSDQKGHRVLKFDPYGKPLATISNSARATLFSEGPGGIAIDARGVLYAPDGLTVVKFSQQGLLLDRWR